MTLPDLTPELIDQAKKAATLEELIAFAKEHGIELPEEQAQAYFEQLHKTGELSDEELDNVAGGCYSKGELVVTAGLQACHHYRCSICGGYRDDYLGVYRCKNPNDMHGFRTACCGSCRYTNYRNALLVCTHPNKRQD